LISLSKDKSDRIIVKNFIEICERMLNE
jgi:hypothetical protein